MPRNPRGVSRSVVDASGANGPVRREVDLVLVVVGVDRHMRTNLPNVFAAGDCFEHAVSRTGLRDHEAVAEGLDPVTIGSEADDHKAHSPGSHKISMRYTGDRTTGRLLGVQLSRHRHAEVDKRIDIAATAIFNEMTVEAMSDLDLSYTPPFGDPWDAVQAGAQTWVRAHTIAG
jgi:pyruvate/2-oxoglutarate dehydrogenase complex dihydrolipoamide dehydrogenase (E3) component